MFIITAKCSKRRVVKILLIFALLLSLFLALRACRHSSPPPVIAAGTNEERIAYLASLGWEVNDQPIETLSVTLGETLEERETGATPSVILRQLNAVLTIVRPEDLLAVAYEPVWAIGTGKTATPEIAQSVHALIRTRLVEVSPKGGASTPILYGGSVKPENAHELFAQPDIDGALVGGAALKASSFLAIANAF